MSTIAEPTLNSIAIDPRIEPSWKAVLSDEFQKPYFKKLKSFLLAERDLGALIYPRNKDIFNAFALTPFDAVKVVILGQDPYHGAGQAHGLAFSVMRGVPAPPSLKNIFKELEQDVAFKIPQHSDLSHWSKQGVLLLNTSLTVRANEANSHRGQGWELFTDAVIHSVSERKEHVVFILWGSPARSKMSLIDTKKHCVLTSAHPSPLSSHRGFFGCRHFSKTNNYLQAHGKTPIDWQL